MNNSINKNKINTIKKERLSIENFQHCNNNRNNTNNNQPINLSLNQSENSKRLDEEEDVAFNDSFLNDDSNKSKQNLNNIKTSASSNNLDLPLVESSSSPNPSVI